jgi:hypothetical protein
MRPARLLLGMAPILALGLVARAQSILDPSTAPSPKKGPAVLYTATVIAPEAEVRCGPSTDPQLYPTNKLRRGDTVEVVEEREGDWLAIVPPPNSFSWINARFLQSDNGVRWYVATHDSAPIPVLYGSSLRNDKPTVEGTKVPRGTIVLSIGPARAADDGMWMPIQPPPGELRYIPANLVAKNGPAAPVPGQSAPVTATPVSNRSSTTAGFAQPGQAVDPRLQRAQQLEQYGNEVRNTNSEAAIQAYNQAQSLRNQERGAAAPPPVRQAVGVHPIPPAGERLAPVPATLQATLRPSNCVPCQTTSSSPGGMQRSGPGWLRRSAWWLDGQPTYALVDSQNRVRMYVTPQPGLNLGPLVDRGVDLTGTIVYRGDLRQYQMRAVQVTPLN